MPRHPDAIITPNTAISKAREGLPSRRRLGQCTSRGEMADAVNRALDDLYPDVQRGPHYVDFRWVGKLERGEHRWPSEYRRAALRRVFGVDTDIELGLYSPRRTISLLRPHDSAASDLAAETPIASAEPSGDRVAVDEVLAAGEPDSVAAWLDRLDGFRWALASQVDPSLAADVHRHLDVLRDLQAGGSRGYLAIVDARWSEFMSWVSENIGVPDGGRWLARARRQAARAADPTLIAYALMRQSQGALLALDVRSAISLSREAVAKGSASSRTRVLCLSRLAEGLASNGDDEALAVVAAARRGLRQAADGRADQVARHCDEQYVSAVEGRCRYLLGDGASARSILGEILRARPAAEQLDLGVWQAYLGEALASGSPDEAAAHGMRALHIAQSSGSFRVVRAAQPLALSLRQHHGHGRFMIDSGGQ